MNVFKNGLVTGLVLQLGIGPVFFFVVNLALQKTLLDGLAGVVAVTLVDYFYITLSILGIGKLLQKKKYKKLFGIVSSIVLILFGMFIISGVLGASITRAIATHSANILTSFTSVFFLTISSPMTIVWYTGLFTAKAVEYNYTKKELIIFGFSVGLATLIFFGTSVMLLSILKGTIPVLLVQLLNVFIGCLLIGYGGVRLVRVLQ